MANFNLNDDDFFNTEKLTPQKDETKKEAKITKPKKVEKKEEKAPVTYQGIDKLFSDEDVLRNEAVNFKISKEESAFIKCAAYRLDFNRPITEFCRAAIRAYIKNLKKDKELFKQISDDYKSKMEK